MDKMKKYDCIVAGGGVAGISSALSLARNGRKVLLIEKEYQLGGLATLGLINWYEPICNQNGKQLLFGIAEELIRDANEHCGTVCQDWIDGKESKKPFAGFFNHSVFSALMTKKLVDAGVEICFDSLITEATVKNGKIESIAYEAVDGKREVLADYFIDATGTARLCSLAGVPTTDGKNVLSFYTHRQNANDKGEYQARFDVFGSFLNGKNQPEHVPLLCGAYAEDVNTYVKESHKVFIDAINGDKKRANNICEIPHMPQFRMIRRIVGEQTITTENKNSVMQDSLGEFGYFCQAENTFSLAYGALYNSKVGNLFAAGRIISAQGEGWDAARVIPTAVLTGEVCALAVSTLINDGKKTNAQMDVQKFKTIIKERKLFNK